MKKTGKVPCFQVPVCSCQLLWTCMTSTLFPTNALGQGVVALVSKANESR
jgi:hypothetical protein